MSEETVQKKKETNGEKFKRTHGFSLSRKKAMRKAGVEDLDQYRKIVKERKKVAKKAKIEKKSIKRAQRGSKLKTKK